MQSNPLQRIPGVALVLVFLITMFSAIAPGFLSIANLSNVLVQSTILMMLALPMTLIIMTEGLDLSMGAVLTLTSLVVAIVSLASGSMLLGLGAAILVGAAFGTLNGWLVAILGIPPFVATLGTLGMAQGLSLIVSDGQSVVGIPPSVSNIYSAVVLGVPVPVVMALATYAFFHLLLYHTRFGTYIFALGGNREALKYAGRLAQSAADCRLCDRRHHGRNRRPPDDRAHELGPPDCRPWPRVRRHRRGRGRWHLLRARQWMAARHRCSESLQ